MAHDPLKQGMLLKRSPKNTFLGGKKMQDRYFVLTAETLYYYLPKDRNEPKNLVTPKGVVPVEDMLDVYLGSEAPLDSKEMRTVARNLGKDAPCTLLVSVALREDGDGANRPKGSTSDVRIYEMRDASERAARAWVAAIRAAVKAPEVAAAAAQEAVGACKNAIAKARKAQQALESAKEAEEAEEARMSAASAADEAMVRAMPVDRSRGPQMTRYCPWFSTAAGCERLSSCPLSHSPLPRELVTYKYRAWALETSDGWIGETVNRPFARVHAL